MKQTILILMLLALVAACTPQPEEALPTLMPTPQSLSPATATPALDQPTAAPTNPPAERATLPPTWTSSPEPTITPIPPTQTPIPLFTALPTLVACGPFDVDREQSAATFTAGTPVQVYWLAVDGASRYRISVLNGFNEEIFFDYAIEPTYTFKPDQFEAGQRYAWRVYPEDSLLRQMCLAVTGDMSPAQ